MRRNETFQTLIEKIVAKHNIDFIDVGTSEGITCCAESQGCSVEQIKENHDNQSNCVGTVRNDPKIWLGIYDDEELRFAAFLHEFSHLRSRYPQFKGKFVRSTHNKYLTEAYTWEYSFKIAKKLGIRFSNKALKYRDKCLRGYEWFTIDKVEIKNVASRLMDLGYKKEASKILGCDCRTGCENCWRATDRAKKEILDCNVEQAK